MSKDKETKETGTEVAKTEENAVAPLDYGEMSQTGFEGTTMKDLSIPFLNVIQDNTKEYKEGEIEGLQPGDILNSVTKEIVPARTGDYTFLYKEAAVVEWRKRKDGGGLIDKFPINYQPFLDAVKANGNSRIPPKDDDGKRIQFKSPDGNELVETYYMYVLLMDPTGLKVSGFGIIAFTSTKIKIFKDWVSSMMMQASKPPLFANRCIIDTKNQTQGSYTFYNLNIKPFKETWADSLLHPVDDKPLLQEARGYYDMVLVGDMRAEFEKQERDDNEEVNTDLTQTTKEPDNEIPF